MPPTAQPQLHASDSVALAVEAYVCRMQAEGYGEFSRREEEGMIVLKFGAIEVRGENCEVALLRLARALLDHPELFQPFLKQMRDRSMIRRSPE